MNHHKFKNYYKLRPSMFGHMRVAREIKQCRSVGLDYIAYCEVSNLIMNADECRRDDKNSVPAQMLIGAAHSVARAHKALSMKHKELQNLKRKKRKVIHKIIRIFG